MQRLIAILFVLVFISLSAHCCFSNDVAQMQTHAHAHQGQDKKKTRWLPVIVGLLGVSVATYGSLLIVNYFCNEKLLKNYYEKRFFETKKISPSGRNIFYEESAVDSKIELNQKVSQFIHQQMLSGLMIEHVRYESSQPAKRPEYVVLYCGGTREDQGDIHPALSQIAEKTGVPIETFNYPGYGNSGGKPGFSINQTIANAFVSQFSDKKIILIGHSYGASVAIELAKQFPQVEHLFVMGAYSSAYQQGWDYAKWYEKPLIPFAVNKQKNNSVLCLETMALRDNGRKLKVMSFHGQADETVNYKHQKVLQNNANENTEFSALGSYLADHHSIFDYSVPYISAKLNKIVNH
ncbi:MAG: alpha/beta hydrolase [Cellvibrionales bacterium]|nr:alpha/beta hydrolase [Cellvibrionales bacterium]